jgi:transcriptional regulator with XRE-family HTH domain
MKNFHSISVKLAEFLRNKRTDLNLTQEELAEKSGVDYKHIQRMESYRLTTDPKYSTLLKLSDALNVDILELIIYIHKQQYSEEYASKLSWLVGENRKEYINNNENQQ